jgi:anti-anti-sigma factor
MLQRRGTSQVNGRSDFHVDSQHSDGYLMVSPHGDVDLATADTVRAALESHDGPDPLLLDLRNVDFLDTSGLRVIVEAAHRAEADGHRFAVVRGPARVQRILDIAGLNARSLVVDDPAEVNAQDDGQA